MALKALILGTEDWYPHLKPFYDLEVQRGNLEIVGYGVFENNDSVKLYANHATNGGD